MTRRQEKQVHQQVKAILTQVILGLAAGLIIGALLALNL